MRSHASASTWGPVEPTTNLVRTCVTARNADVSVKVASNTKQVLLMTTVAFNPKIITPYDYPPSMHTRSSASPWSRRKENVQEGTDERSRLCQSLESVAFTADTPPECTLRLSALSIVQPISHAGLDHHGHVR